MSNWEYTINSKHGFGILFGKKKYQEPYPNCFYEDGTLNNKGYRDEYEDAIHELENTGISAWKARANNKEIQTAESLMKQNPEARFSPGQNGSLIVDLTIQNKDVHLSVGKGSYFYSVKCSCGSRVSCCAHMRVAALLMKQRLDALQHAYVVTDLPVDKGQFLEPGLYQMVRDTEGKGLNLELYQDLHEIIRKVDSAKSDDYYRLFHRSLMNMSPVGYYDNYDARYLEEQYEELLIALFEDPEYKRVILDTGEYAETKVYEDRQYRSNRTSLKRVLKEYQKAIKGLDGKGDYSYLYEKEAVLKYRSDWTGLLRYYAVACGELRDDDTSFLEEIAKLPALEAKYVGPVVQMLENKGFDSNTASIARRMLEKVPSDQRIEIYSQLRTLSMPAEEIRNLKREDQLRMIRNTPLNEESFRYIMDDLLRDSDTVTRGHFILFAMNKAKAGSSPGLNRLVVAYAKQLPDNRLLLGYVTSRLNLTGENRPNEGDAEKELTTYFACNYEIFRDKKQMHVDFTVKDPESDTVLLRAEEGLSYLKQKNSLFNGYTPKQIKDACVKGKEEAYREAFEQNEDALAADLFERDHQKFALGYKELCSSLQEEKILYTDDGKVNVDWLVYWENGSGALAFKVGHGRMYIVKDAMEFIQSFRSNATVEYGKDLIMTHDIANLKDTDAGLIRLLMTANLTKGRQTDPNNRRYITVDDALLANVLEGLNGRTVSFNDTPCLIRMEPKKVRLKVSSGYSLTTDIDKGTQSLINLLGKGYLVTQPGKGEQAVLDRIDESPEEVNLTSLIQQNPSTSIKPILRDFKKNIYSRFFEMFDVDKAVEKDFTLSQIRLNTYFDFDKGIISARTDVLRDDKVIRPEKLTDRIDRVKVELLDSYLQSLGFADGVLTEESRVLAFFKMDFTRLKTLTNVYLSDSLKNKELKSVGKPVIRVTYQNNLVRVFLERSDFTEDELEQIIAGLRKKRKYILLSGDRIVDLDSETARDFGETVKDFEMDPKDLYRKKTISMINAIKAFSHERSCKVDKYLRDMIEEIRTFKDSDIAVPQINATLRDYQVEGFKWLSILTKYGMGGILADDMGLGKTIQMITLLKSDRSRKPSLVVCPKSLVFNWISEFARFDGTTRVTAIYGPDSRRSELIAGINGKEKGVFITSYDSLRNDISKYTVDFNYVILDEAQYIKNVNALKTKSVKELKAAHRFALTGTPIENSVVDLWSIFDFIMPGYFEELSRFRETDTAAIARKAAPFILRRVKEDVLEDLPAKYERILSADMSEGQRKLYDAMRLEAKRALEDGGKAFDLLPYLTRLRQVCVDPGMFVEDYQGGSGKMDMLATMIPEYLEEHHRILIFSQFVKALESVEKMLNAKGIPTYFLSGATSAKDRVQMMDSFNNGSGTDVFLISLKAGGTGLNLTGADTVIHLDPWWNVAAENQASDRTHRIGQTRNVEVIKLIAGESIEQRVVELQDIKKEVIKQVISDDDGSVTSASLEDIAFVLD